MRMQIAAVCATALALGGGTALAEGTGQSGSQSPTGQSESQSQQERETASGAEAGVSDAEIQEAAGQDALSLESLSREQKMELQRRLQQEGFYDGKIDGIVGPMTLAALQQYQDREGIAGGGAFNQETAERLGIDTSEMQAVSGTEQGPSATGTVSQQQRAGAGTSQPGMQPGAQPSQPSGATQPGQAAQGQVAQPAQGAEPGMVAAPSEPESIELSALDTEQAKSLQQKLQELGFYKGAVDGIVGPKTKAALRSYFQQRAQLASQGQITTEDAQAMGLSVSDVQPVRGAEEGGAAPAPRGGQAPSAPAAPTAPTGTTPSGASTGPSGAMGPQGETQTGQIRQESQSGAPSGQQQPRQRTTETTQQQRTTETTE